MEHENIYVILGVVQLKQTFLIMIPEDINENAAVK